jgi:hypothetical protein
MAHFSSPKCSSKTSPGNGLKTRTTFLECSCALRKPRGLYVEWIPLKAGLFFFAILALANGRPVGGLPASTLFPAFVPSPSPAQAQKHPVADFGLAS